MQLALDTRQEQSLAFRWSQDIYKQQSDTAWRPLSSNTTIRKLYQTTKSFDSFLSKLDIPFTHDVKGPLQLRDIFIYPHVTTRPMGGVPVTTEIRGDALLAHCRSRSRILFQGGPLSGKTSLAKTLFTDMLNAGDVIPIFLDGEDLKARSDSQLVDTFWKTFKTQYGDNMLEHFRQLPKERRALVIDNWHKSSLSVQGRRNYLKIASGFFGRLLLFTDNLFQIQEVADRAVSSFVQFDWIILSAFRHELRGRLIDKWLTLGGGSSLEPLSHETEEVERILITVINKNTLPSTPFIILCLLQALQEDKVQSAEAGSFGYLYEVLVTTALNSSVSGRPQLEKKYVFLARLAFDMFKHNVPSLPDARVRDIATTYASTHLVKINIDSLLTDLVAARVLSIIDGNYSFADSYLLYYFIARYYKDNLDSADGDELRNDMAMMVEHVASDKYSTILLFILYFVRNTKEIISALVTNANRIFHEGSPADFVTDVGFLDPTSPVQTYALPERVDTAANRQERRLARDKADDRLASTSRARDIDVVYSDDLPDADKFALAFKHIGLLGQVIRNFPGSLPGPEKLAILESTYLLGLRVLRAMLQQWGAAAQDWRRIIKDRINRDAEENKPDADREASDNAEKFILLIAKMLSLVIVKEISASVGLSDLEEAYALTLGKVGRSPATSLVDLSIKLDHFPGFPESDVRELHRFFAKHRFADELLLSLVVYHILVFDIDNRTRQSMERLFNLKANTPLLLSSHFKK